MNEPLGINLWNKPTKSRGKPTKLELITEIRNITHAKNLEISTLSLSDLKSILKKAEQHETLNAVEDIKVRAKRPYIELLQPFFPKVKNLDKLSIAGLKSLLEAFTDDQ